MASHSESQRENWIDVAKGIGMLMIIVGHVSTSLEGRWTFDWVYGVHVMIFFLLSGYTFKVRPLTKEYINKRFSRLMIPYFMTCLAVMAMDIWNSRCLSHDWTISGVTHIIGDDLIRSFFASGTVRALGTLDIPIRIGAVWFLPALFFATLIVQIVLQKVKKTEHQGLLLCAIAVLAYLTRDFFWLPFSIQSGMAGSVFVWIGYLFKEKQVETRLKWYHNLTAGLVYVWAYLKGLALVRLVAADAADLFISVLAGLCGCLIIGSISKKIEKSAVLSHIGKNSLTVLCVHLFALETMGPYFKALMDKAGLQGNTRVWCYILIHIVFAVAGAGFVGAVKRAALFIREKHIHAGARTTISGKAAAAGSARNIEVDVARGIFITAMLIGHFPIDAVLRNVIYSCHMIAFILISGYFYKKPENMAKTLIHMVRAYLLPYVVFTGCFFLLNYKSWSYGFLKDNLIRFALGISFAKNIFADIPSVGPVYFILLLFVIRCIYMILDRYCTNEKMLACMVIAVSLAGLTLGQRGWWLPWSIDVALYGVVFYYAGVLFRRYEIIDKVMDRPGLYFVLSPVWAYMIYAGSMEIAIRKYGNYGLVVLGAVCGVLVVMQLSGFISGKAPVLCRFFREAGEKSLYVIIVTVLLRDIIENFLGKWLAKGFFPLMIVSICIQLLIALAVGKCIELIKTKHAVYSV